VARSSTADAGAGPTPAEIAASSTSETRGSELLLGVPLLGIVLVLYVAIGFGLYTLFGFLF